VSTVTGAERTDPKEEALVTVLMATYNGTPWLGAQVSSILDQRGVRVELVVSDDGSEDGTWEWLEALAESDERVHLLGRASPTAAGGTGPDGAVRAAADSGATDPGPPGGTSAVRGHGAPAANFYRLLREAELGDGRLVAFADQDDVWHAGKLAAAAALIRTGQADGVSSDVVAFDEGGKRHLVRKSYPQRRFDYVFEGAGPGSTILLSSRLAALAREVVVDPAGPAGDVEFHDWLVYALCRARGWPWIIRSEPTVDYRQHSGNAFGANAGLAAARTRFRLIRLGWHRRQSAALVRAVITVASPRDRAQLQALLALLADRRWAARRSLARRCGQMRRRARDRWIMGALVLAGVW
jgi:rhamnosyltransferase